MPKLKISKKSKALLAVKEYPKEFCLSHDGSLFCSFCKVKVTCEKKFNIDSHRKSAKHCKYLYVIPEQPKLFAEKGSDLFAKKVTEAFLSADIPLYKLRNFHIIELFKSMNHPLPSESTCRNQIDLIDKDLYGKIAKIVQNKKIFLLFDETCLNGTIYGHTLMGTLDYPEQTYLARSSIFQKSLSASDVAIEIDEVLKDFSISRENFVLLLSDAARYMVSAGKNLKLLNPNLFHITCISHLMHNAAEIVRNTFQDVDRLITSIKAATVKNKSRKQLFASIGFPPSPVITRWGSWIDAALYYSRHLPQVRQIFSEIEGDGILVISVKKALNEEGLDKSLQILSSQYKSLSTIAIEIEGDNYTIENALKKLDELDFGDDYCGVLEYIKQRVSKNDILSIQNMTNKNLSPEIYAQLMKCPPSSASVERSFSMLNAMMVKNRNFSEENCSKYIRAKYNSFLI